MNIKRLNYIPHLDQYIAYNNLDNHNKSRFIKSILEKKGKHFKNYNKYLIENNIQLHFEDLETFNQYKFTEYAIKNTQANYYKYEYNLKILEEEYEDFEIVDYKTLAFKHFKMILKFNFIKWCKYVANGYDAKSHILLYHGKYIFDNMDENIIDKILFNNSDIKEGINNEVKTIYSQFLDKMNIRDKEFYLKDQYCHYGFKDLSLNSQKRNALNFIKKNYILNNDIFYFEPNSPNTYCQLPQRFNIKFFEWLLFIKINNNNINDKKLRDKMHNEMIDINIIKKLEKTKISNIKEKKIEKKHSYKHWINRIEKLEKVELPRYLKNGDNKRYDFCQERLIYYKNKISVYNNNK